MMFETTKHVPKIEKPCCVFKNNETHMCNDDRIKKFIPENHFRKTYTNLLLTEREGPYGEYWPEVVTVRTEHRQVRIKTTEGQYSPVRLEQARLVSSLLYGTRHIILYSRTSGA